MFHVVKNQIPTVDSDHAPPFVLLRAALRVRLTQSPQSAHAVCLWHASSPHDAGPSRWHEPVPTGRGNPSRFSARANRYLLGAVGEFARFSEQKRGYENLSSLAIEPERRVQYVSVEFYECH